MHACASNLSCNLSLRKPFTTKTTTIALREILLPGIEVTKHGRSGRPNKRILFCDSDFTFLYWRAPGILYSLFMTFLLHSFNLYLLRPTVSSRTIHNTFF